MKNYFKLMSLLLGMVLCSAAFVACGDDDDDGQYAGNRLIGEWVWGEPNQNQQEMHMREAWEGESFERLEYGTFVLNDLKLKITWTKEVYKEHGKIDEEPLEEPYVDEYEIVYPETGNTGMFLKYKIEGREGYGEEGPFYKK